MDRVGRRPSGTATSAVDKAVLEMGLRNYQIACTTGRGLAYPIHFTVKAAG